MKKNGFTFLEILVVLFIVGTLTILGIGGFSHTLNAHRVDTLMQELALLRSAIVSYKEMHGTLPSIEELSDLSSSSFDALKTFWYPFHPENSKIIEGSRWYGVLDDSTEMGSFLVLKRGEEEIAFDIEILKKKLQNLCAVDPSGKYFYILAPYTPLVNPPPSDFPIIEISIRPE